MASPGTDGVWIVSASGLDEALDLFQVPEPSPTRCGGLAAGILHNCEN